MDKIDVLLAKYRGEEKLSQVAKETIILLVVILTIEVLQFVFMAIWSRLWWIYVSIYFLFLVILFVIPEVQNGNLGTKKWKKAYRDYQRKRFVENQGRLATLIKESGMTNQQVYNCLKKRKSEMPPRRDKAAYIVSVCAFIMSFANIFLDPLDNIAKENYAKYVAIVIIVLSLISLFVFIFSKVIVAMNTSYETKFLERHNYEYIIKLLEDMLY